MPVIWFDISNSVVTPALTTQAGTRLEFPVRSLTRQSLEMTTQMSTLLATQQASVGFLGRTLWSLPKLVLHLFMRCLFEL